MNRFEEMVEDGVAGVEELIIAYPPSVTPDDVAFDPRFTNQLIIMVSKYLWDAAQAGQSGFIKQADFFRHNIQAKQCP